MTTHADSQAAVAFSDSWDHYSEEFHTDFYEKLETARSTCPVPHSNAYGGMWMVTRYGDVKRVLHDWETFSSADGVVWPRSPDLARQIPIDIDPPRQQEYRRMLQPFFTASTAKTGRDGARRLVTELIDGFIERGEADVAAEFTRIYPALYFIEEVMGGNRADLPQLMEWGKAVAHDQGTEVGERAFAEMAEWIQQLVDSSGSPVILGIKDLMAAEPPLTPHEAVMIVHLLVVGGLDTTANVLGNVMYHFATQPELFDRLEKDPELIPQAIEEFIRFEPAVMGLFRTVTTEVELGGVTMKPGDGVLVSYASANRDESEFQRANVIDFDRESNRHMGFGLGVHRCLGIHLARLELAVAIEEVVGRLKNLQLAGPVTRQQTYVRGPLTMPMTFTPGSVLGPAR